MKIGRHARDPAICRQTWGTCDARSNDKDANPSEQTLPHICGAGMVGAHNVHECEAPNCSAHQV